MAEDVKLPDSIPEAGSKVQPKFAQLKFVELWAESLSSVLGQITGRPFSFASQDTSPTSAEATDKDLYVTITASGSARGEMCLRISPLSAVALAKAFVGERAEGEITDDDRGALEELLRQVGGHVAASAKKIWQELQLNVSLSQAPAWPPAATGWLRSLAGAPAEIAVQWSLSAALNTSLACMPAEQAMPAQPQPASAEPAPARLGMFMDLELEVTLRFGGRDVLLKDILQLGPGSVLELDREIQDPADLLLEGKIIARGEVVMVDGNFGLRVTEVVATPAA